MFDLQMPGSWKKKKKILGILKLGFVFQEQILADIRNRAYYTLDHRVEEDFAFKD